MIVESRTPEEIVVFSAGPSPKMLRGENDKVVFEEAIKKIDVAMNRVKMVDLGLQINSQGHEFVTQFIFKDVTIAGPDYVHVSEISALLDKITAIPDFSRC